MKKYILVSSLVLFFGLSKAQITISKNDFANAGDTFRISTASGVGINNVDSTGANMIWDYSSLTSLSQTVDTFVSVASTPALYQFYFNNQFLYPNTKATIATKISLPSIPSGAGITISNAIGYAKVNSISYAQVGFGATISGIPTSIPYDSVDYQYRFPMNYGNVDSCKYKFQISIPSLGYLRRRASRVNHVDGWGTLITPYGTFQTLRVKSFIYATDTIYISAIMFGTQLVQPTSIEYKWIGIHSGIPYLQINANDGVIPTITSVMYRDSLRPSIFTGVNNLENPVSDIEIYPNPSNAQSILSFLQTKSSRVSIEIYDATGKMIDEVYSNMLPEGFTTFSINLSNKATGLYFVRIKNDTFSVVKKLNKI